MGPEVTELENRLSDFTGVSHAVSCASGTDALLMALMAYDIDPVTFNISPTLLKKAINALNKKDDADYPIPAQQPLPLKPKGIIAVDLFGLPADYSKINRIAKSFNLFVIEDAAQSFGAQYNGQQAGSLASIGCTSFFPAKPLGCYGDGGMCFTDDPKVADVLRSIRIHGQGLDKYNNIRVGINGRLDTLQAAILLAKFDIYPEEVKLRNTVAQRYTDMLQDTKSLTTPTIEKGFLSVWAQYSLLSEDSEHRSRLQHALKMKNIPTAIYYPIPLHLQAAFKSLGYKHGDFPVSERCSERIFSIPMHPYLDENTQKEIVSTLKHT
jgi:dTDP-4-amino-4,6-dideoxygalactose transaminase